MLRIFITLIAALGLSTAASATPSDITSFHDEMFGINDSHLFVLRTTDDNLGSYYENRNEVFLVAIDLATAQEEYWPLYQVTQTTDFGDDGTDDRIVIEPNKGPGNRNAFAILTEHKALPWLGPNSWRNPVSMEDNAGDITITYQDDVAYRLTSDDLAKRLASSIASVANNVVNHRRMSTITTREMFAMHNVSIEQCTFTDPAGHFSRSAKKWLQFVRVTCGDEEDGGSISVIQPVPAVERL